MKARKEKKKHFSNTDVRVQMRTEVIFNVESVFLLFQTSPYTQ